MSQRMSAEARRAEIVEAAGRAIIAHGVGGFRVRDVADEAGVSQPLVSNHFRSREELVRDAFVQADERATAVITERSAGEADALAALRVELQLCLDDAGDPIVAQAWRLWQELWTHGMVAPELRGVIAERQHAWIARIEDLIERGMEDGSMRPGVDRQAAALLLTTLVDGLGPSLRWGFVDMATALAMLDDAMRERLAA
jgi:TetR/AcrR family transcriptional repressor of bet genes